MNEAKQVIRENVEAWCEALESGEYEQTQDALYKDGGYCCLGVARCVLTGHRGRWFGLSLTPAEQDALGIRDAMSHLMNLNDGWGKWIGDGVWQHRLSFDQIAEIIRREHPVFRDEP